MRRAAVRALQVLFPSGGNVKPPVLYNYQKERAHKMAGFKRMRGFPALPAKKEDRSTTTTKSPKEKASSTPSKLLELPPELRDKIFRYALVSNEPIKLEFSSYGWRSKRRRFTMIPGLINASKQLRSETQRMFFEENTFEITPEVWKQRSVAPLLFLRTMHHDLGLELGSVRVCQEKTMRDQKMLFRLKASFTISIDANDGLTIAEQDYSITYIGRSLGIAPHFGVCGCHIANEAGMFNHFFRGSDVIQFLLNLKDWGILHYSIFRSHHVRDLLRKDKVVRVGRFCQECRGRGLRMVYF